MNKTYINGIGSISAQKTFDNNGFLDEVVGYDETVIPAIDPIYKDYIPPAAARRMAKGIKMGVVASKIALNEAGLENVDAIITGTGMGCVIDSEKFVSAIIDNNEAYLTPTSFIQSTHNTVGGQVALGMGCKGYNFTYVHSSNSFESALLDSLMQLEGKEAQYVLVGGVDELGEHTTKVHKLVHHIKEQVEDSLKVLGCNTKGAIFSEGANFFVLSNEKRANTYAELCDVGIYNTLSKAELTDTVTTFLRENGVALEELDLVVIGNNGDEEFDGFYNTLGEGLFKDIPQAYYKHLCGEFNTASAFGVWLASKILRTGQVPEIVKLNDKSISKPKNVLLYNQYRGENHSLVLLKKC
ncbi:beta-ketoacyl synthase chain length factor [Flavobacteriaceae bacterium F89]|uniref:Beta-ketoacyl synthase chain length factor n=1 Tax=Cerina litoralis TaxID=2874477 RepID=A0AAE3ETJ1_9FLAO|nr:beta-ketoacyl synthase N-terminal-like domain-containing protein [Cerina litoralis]MCG2460173.1 beta-ketoacyl synthase chain length factor [Cerina litoralis]